jgi:protein AATF/BFR2
VHEKAQSFTVASELPGGWHDEQIDELFSSLLGGAGARGATSQKSVIPSGVTSDLVNGDHGGLAGLGGLRVF